MLSFSSPFSLQRIESQLETATDIDFASGSIENLTIKDSHIPTPGGPFSAIIPSMWPQEILTKLALEADKFNDPNEQPDYRLLFLVAFCLLTSNP